ncbi:hypothetical protein MJO28_001458 [Puccinia striiformis f. sp. tritici]|uniref:Uncharacterized protein n=1 Tax=Puccinia striiformis f. sp. tritici TaxID=168172 RepID=A0ACC0EVA7_9BASI|nr:hypothetical protein Pst134EA_003276 [Puccinia striiformis f. sp. tritici]KAH9472672.1 hypothetical protein Pst134EA_003276 [Puccinia striiformis f. sp. tritici]KAI7960969.1 hypothetical protein MJO28_001458 [Puccinia striiformis f. sp. tritici]KAI7965752.1 hypothetical protein MJO29_001500 [Puccinia striiformis f. sp. tritici]
MSRYSPALKTTLHLIKRAVQVTAGVSLFKDKVGDLRWCEGGSMLPTLNVTGDLLLQIPISSIFNFRLGGDRTIDNSSKTGGSPIEPTTNRLNLNRGDLVNFTSPLNPSVLACKRIIGLPGDKILVDDHPYPHNFPNPNSGVTDEIEGYDYCSHKSLLTIPQGHLWLQGDNYAVSIDSRTYGPVPIGLVSGKILARVWPDFTWLSQPFEYK